MSFTIGTSGYDQHGPMHAIETFGKDPAGSRGFDLRTTLRLAAFLRPHWLRMTIHLRSGSTRCLRNRLASAQ